MKPPKIAIRKIQYYPIAKHWRRLKPFFEYPESEQFWRLNMRDYYEQRMLKHQIPYQHDESKYSTPSDYDSCDWRWCRPGRHPQFWNYVCHSACHWLVDCNLFVATNALPQFQWRIVSSPKHSTVWNGDAKNPVLFDLNFLALEVSAKEAWEIASVGHMKKPGKYLRPYVFYKGYFKQS